jgi:glycine/D-amino acid oxidase-like deaminating enzyme
LVRFDDLVIGGGFYGCRLALARRARGRSVVLLEKEPELLRRASYNNQARVHNGYHYPRSILTALRSHHNYPRFVSEYHDCLDGSFEKVYAVARTGSKISAGQFVEFCRRIGAFVEPATREIAALFDADLVEAVFHVKEVAFDGARLARRLQHELAEAGVDVRLGWRAERVAPGPGGLLVSAIGLGNASATIESARVFNCTYSMLNQTLVASGLPMLALKHELTELALVEVPPMLRNLGITVMDGPFFSVMPFPARGLHTLSHVRYTPHYAWHDTSGAWFDPHGHVKTALRRSQFIHMRQDAMRYLPAMKECRSPGSLWEVKTVLPASESSDSRPILFRRNHGLPGLTCILGGKIDNIYDVLQELDTAEADL